MNQWISKTPRPKNEIFECPFCNGKVTYIDGLARRKAIKRTAQCDYNFCPWCGTNVNDDNVRIPYDQV